MSATVYNNLACSSQFECWTFCWWSACCGNHNFCCFPERQRWILIIQSWCGLLHISQVSSLCQVIYRSG